jgi:hypothetical protein
MTIWLPLQALSAAQRFRSQACRSKWRLATQMATKWSSLAISGRPAQLREIEATSQVFVYAARRQGLEDRSPAALVHFEHEVGYRGIVRVEPFLDLEQPRYSLNEGHPKSSVGAVDDLQADVGSREQAAQSRIQIFGTRE